MISFSAIPTIAESYIGSTTIVWLYIFRTIRRLNSGNFGIFDHTQSFINLESSVCRAWEIISNDTKISMIPWEPDIKNSFWNFCVGVWVGGQPWTNFSQSSKDAQFNCASFDTSIVFGGRWGKIVLFKKLLEKRILRGLKLHRFDSNPINHNENYLKMLRTKNQTLWSYLFSNSPTHIHTAHAISKFG